MTQRYLTKIASLTITCSCNWGQFQILLGKMFVTPKILAVDKTHLSNGPVSQRLDYEQSLCLLIVRRERSEKNRPRESSFRAAYFFRFALNGL